jgi:hypothetical protein
MRKVETVLQLQEVDTALDRSGERLAAVITRLEDRSELDRTEAEHEVAAAQLRRETATQQDLEQEVEGLRQKLSQLEKKLYGGTVANPKELEAMTLEARQFRNQISTREDRLIEQYDKGEAASTAAAEASTRLEQTKASHENRQRELSSERDELRASIAENEARRTAVLAEIDAATLRTYEGLRRTRGGLAVAEIAQRTCQGCRVTLPVNEEIKARSSQDLVFCQSCGRILYAAL